MSVLNKYNIRSETGQEDGLHVYIVPVGTLLYRGDTTLYQNSRKIPNTRAFFALEKCRSRPYGILHTFRVKKELELVRTDMDNFSLLVYIQHDKDVQEEDTDQARKILTRGFGFGRGNKRETIREDDYKLLDIVCKTGFDGFMGDEMEIDGFQNIDRPERKEGENEEIDESKFHREIALCNPQDMLDYVGTDEYTREEIGNLEEKENAKKINEQQAKLREEAKKRGPKKRTTTSIKEETGTGETIDFNKGEGKNDPFASPPKRSRADSIGSLASSASSAGPSRAQSAVSIADSLAGDGVNFPQPLGGPSSNIQNRVKRAPSQPALSPHGRLSGPQKFSPSPSEKNKLEGLIKIEGTRVDPDKLPAPPPRGDPGMAEEVFDKAGVFSTPSPRTPKTKDNEKSVEMTTPKGGKKKKSRKQMKKRKKSRKHKKSRKAKKVKSARKTKRKQKTRKYKK